MPNLYTITNNNIAIHVQPEFIEAESSATESIYIWAYFIKIENKSKDVVQLLNRYWNITDGHGLVQEVRGVGVIGLQPVIEPLEVFEYNSSVNLCTSNGIMHGSYEFKKNDGEIFTANTPIFSLDSSEQINMPN